MIETWSPSGRDWRSCWSSSTTISPEAVADRYVVMSRGEVVARGEGEAMEKDGVRKLLAV